MGVIEPLEGFLKKVKKLAHANGAVLIFDEVVTGFRFALGGAQEYFGVTPDIGCFGKAMANGLPIAAVVGKRSIMKLFDDVFFSLTFGGEAESIAAAIATIKELKTKNVIGHLWALGSKLKDGYNVFAMEYGVRRYTECMGFPPRTVVTFKDRSGRDWWELKSLFQQECIKRGILFSGGHNICFSHSHRDIDYTLNVYRTCLEIVAHAIESGRVKKMLKGTPVQPIFRKA